MPNYAEFWALIEKEDNTDLSEEEMEEFLCKLIDLVEANGLVMYSITKTLQEDEDA